MLDRKSRLKRQHYRKAKTSNDSEVWAAYQQLDGEIRTELKNNKPKIRKQLAANLAQEKPQDVSIWTRKLMEKINDGQATNHRIKLQPDKFTTHMTTKSGEGCTVEQLSFEIGNNFKELVKSAILRATRIKATGRDKIFSTALNCAGDEAAELLTSIWQICSALKSTLKQWATATLITIYKNRPETEPNSYR